MKILKKIFENKWLTIQAIFAIILSIIIFNQMFEDEMMMSSKMDPVVINNG